MPQNDGGPTFPLGPPPIHIVHVTRKRVIVK